MHLGLDVLRHQALSDDVDALAVSQDVSSALGVVHQGLDAADQRRVHLRLAGVVVHGAEEAQDAGQAVQIDEPRHKPVQSERSFLSEVIEPLIKTVQGRF